MSNWNSGSARQPASTKGVKIGIIAAVVVVLALFGGCAYVTSFDAPRPGYAAVCQTGGPIEGDSGTCGVKQRGSGRENIGYENKLVEFPATQRTLLFAFAEEDDRAKPDGPPIEIPLADGNVGVAKVQVQFTQNTDEKSLISFYKAFGTRTFGGPSAADDPDEWFRGFLANQVKPIVDGAIREESAPYRCADVNPSCDLDRLSAQLTEASNKKDGQAVAPVDPEEEKKKGAQAASNLNAISQAATERLGGKNGKEGELASTLGGDYLTGIKVKILRVDPPGEVREEVQKANAAKARLVTAQADSQAREEEARGVANARVEEARGRKALAESYVKNSALADVEIAKALCGPDGCQNLQVLGGGGNLLMELKKNQE